MGFRIKMIMLMAVLGVSGGPARAATPAEAAALLASQDWAGARAAYAELVKENPDNATYQFSLGRAEHGLGNCGKAMSAYRKALTLDYQPQAGPHLQIARCHAASGDRAKALTELERMAATRSGPYTGGPTNLVILALAEFAGYQGDPRFDAAVEKMKPCGMAEHRQFDFWVGYWEIRSTSAPDGPVLGVNDIQLINNGCTVHESYRSAAGYLGQSFSFYDAQLKKWHQTWTDFNGFPLYMDGGLNENGEMVLIDSTSTPGTVHETTWTPLPDSLRQHWRSSTDGGKTWSTAFDGVYKRIARP